MTQVTSYTVAKASGGTVRQGFNAILAAVRDFNRGVTAPPNPVAGMPWLDNSNPANPVLKISNNANNAFVPLNQMIGDSAFGLSLATVADAAAARTLLGSTAIGTSLITAADAAAARAAIQLTYASFAEAQAGTATDRATSPLRVMNAIDARHVDSAVVSTNGLGLYEVTGIPSWAKKITVILDGVQSNAPNWRGLQLGDSGGFETSGYEGSSGFGSALNQYSIHSNYVTLMTNDTADAANLYSGAVEFIKEPGANTWIYRGNIHASTWGVPINIAGRKTLSATLDRVRLLLTTSAGSAYIGGTMFVRWEV